MLVKNVFVFLKYLAWSLLRHLFDVLSAQRNMGSHIQKHLAAMSATLAGLHAEKQGETNTILLSLNR